MLTLKRFLHLPPSAGTSTFKRLTVESIHLFDKLKYLVTCQHNQQASCVFVSSLPPLKSKSKIEEMDPKKQKKFEKEEKDFRKKFKV